MPPVKPPKGDSWNPGYPGYGMTGADGQPGTMGPKGVPGKIPNAVFKTEECSFGTNLVDDVRKFVGDKDLPIEKIINSTSCKLQEYIMIALTEVQARVSQRFQDTQFIEVKVPPLFLSGYQDLTYKVTKLYKFRIAKFKKHIHLVHINNNILEQDIVNDWIKAGSPLKWNNDEYPYGPY
jgi:hypothetical protein